MHLSESVPQDLMCLRSRCVAVRWIQPSDLYVTIEDCSSPSAEPPVPATVHWRQRAALISRTRDRQSSYNPQLCSACAPRTVVRRSLGDHLSTRARTRGTCSPGPPGEDQAIFSEIGEITLIARRSRFPPSPAAAVSGPSLRYIETSRPATVSHARRRAYPPCHSMHDHRWGQRCSCDCGFGLTSRPLACSCTLPGAMPPSNGGQTPGSEHV